MIFRLLKLYSFNTITSIVYIASAKRNTRPLIMIENKTHFSVAVLLQVASKNYWRRYFTPVFNFGIIYWSPSLASWSLIRHINLSRPYNTSIYLDQIKLKSSSLKQDTRLHLSYDISIYVFHVSDPFCHFYSKKKPIFHVYIIIMCRADMSRRSWFAI